MINQWSPCAKADEERINTQLGIGYKDWNQHGPLKDRLPTCPLSTFQWFCDD